MGSADIVPGVSGGTIALVLGIYERLVANVHGGAKVLGQLVRFDGRAARAALRQVEWTWLIPLAAGLATAVVVLTSVLEHQLEERPEVMSAVFFGLVAASIVVAWDSLANRDGTRLVLLVTVAAVSFVVLGLKGDEIAEPAAWYLVAAGAVALCAAILPGVSGSFVLVMLGLYEVVIDAVNDRDLGVLALVGLGGVVGLALFSSLLNRLLRDHHDTVIAALIGIMLGSLRILWPWPAAPGGGIDESSLGAPEAATAIPAVLAAVAAGVVVVALARWSRSPSPAGARPGAPSAR